MRANSMQRILQEKQWISLGYSDYPNFEYIKHIKEVSRTRSRACLKANIDEKTMEVRFYPVYKKRFDYDDCCAMLYLENEFMEIAKQYGFQRAKLK